jgi:hypothetical protein
VFLILFYFALILGLVPIALLTIRKEKVVIEHFPILPFILLVLFSSCYEFLMTHILQVATFLWSKVYLFLEFFAFLYFFYFLLKRKFPFFFIFFSVIYILLFLLILFCLADPWSLTTDSYLSAIEIVMVYFFSILWFRDCFVNAEIDLLKMPDFYFMVGIIFYLSGTFFLNLMGDMIVKDKGLSLDNFWILNIICNIFLRLSLILGVWKIQRK